MSNNTIQIRRSTVTATPASLANGELAFSGVSNSLFIGLPDGSGVSPAIAGVKYGYLHSATPGTSSANAVLITDTNGYLANLSVTEINFGPGVVINSFSTDISSNVSNNQIAPTWAVKQYVDGKFSNVSINTAAQYTWTNSHTFENTLTLGTGAVTATINATSYSGEAASALTANQATTANNAAYLGGVAAANYLDTSNGMASYTVAGAVSFVGGITVNNTITANGTYGTAGQVLKTAGATGVYWANADAAVAGSNTQVQFNDSGAAGASGTFTFDNAVTKLTVKDGAAGEIEAGGNILAGGNVNAASFSVGANLVANSTAIVFQGATVNASAADLSVLNATIAGNLTVNGTTTTINTQTLTVTDPLIKLANSNASDAVDIGFYGLYNDGTDKYTGIFRDATDGGYKLFSGLATEPGTTVGSPYDVATLTAYLNSSALTTNSTAVSITANSTVSVSITANTLTLGTPLAVGSGGTGLTAVGTDGQLLMSNGTAMYWGALDGGTF